MKPWHFNVSQAQNSGLADYSSVLSQRCVKRNRNVHFWFFFSTTHRRKLISEATGDNTCSKNWRCVSGAKHFKILVNSNMSNWIDKTCMQHRSGSNTQICGLLFCGVGIALAHTMPQSWATSLCAAPAQAAASLHIQEESSNICRADGRTWWWTAGLKPELLQSYHIYSQAGTQIQYGFTRCI